MSVRVALAKLSACAAGGAIIGGGAVHVAEHPRIAAQYMKFTKDRAAPRRMVAHQTAKRPAVRRMLTHASRACDPGMERDTGQPVSQSLALPGQPIIATSAPVPTVIGGDPGLFGGPGAFLGGFGSGTGRGTGGVVISSSGNGSSSSSTGSATVDVSTASSGTNSSVNHQAGADQQSQNQAQSKAQQQEQRQQGHDSSSTGPLLGTGSSSSSFSSGASDGSSGTSSGSPAPVPAPPMALLFGAAAAIVARRRFNRRAPVAA